MKSLSFSCIEPSNAFQLNYERSEPLEAKVQILCCVFCFGPAACVGRRLIPMQECVGYACTQGVQAETRSDGQLYWKPGKSSEITLHECAERDVKKRKEMYACVSVFSLQE